MPAGPVERSVVIPAHGQAPLTQACLRRLQASELERTEIVVVEDGATGLELDDAGPLPVRHVRRAEQSGFAAACNAGAAAAQGRELVFLNNDTLPSEGWLDALSRCARDHPGTGIVGAKLLWPDDTVQHAGVVFDGDGNGLHLYEGFPAAPSRGRQAARAAGRDRGRDARPARGVRGGRRLRRGLRQRLGGRGPLPAGGGAGLEGALRARQRRLSPRGSHPGARVRRRRAQLRGLHGALG